MTAPRPSRTKEDVVKDFRTSEILDATRRVIGELGYADASMERIAQEAGVAKGTLYLYFKSKESLLLAACEHGFDELMTRTRDATERVRGSTAKVGEVAREFLAHASENQAFIHALRERPDLWPEGTSEISEDIRALIDQYTEFVASFVERGIRSREFRKIDPTRAARVLTVMLQTVVADRLVDPDPSPISEDAAVLLDYFLHGVGAGDSRE
jgi:AcrR family transcriptional regulator